MIDALKISRILNSKHLVTGLSHNLYRYPARFSPRFVREIIASLSQPGDLVVDPFVGGGTSAVEALSSGRNFLGCDINPIAVFASKAKVTTFSKETLSEALRLISAREEQANSGGLVPKHYLKDGYLNNVPRRFQRLVAPILTLTEDNGDPEVELFIRSVLLKTSQWALDCREHTPTGRAIRARLILDANAVYAGAKAFTQQCESSASRFGVDPVAQIHLSAAQELPAKLLVTSRELVKAKLIVTSPPYAGTHIVYHQWQIKSRRRTRAPFWLINSMDGMGAPYYTFGDYRTHTRSKYFEEALEVYSSMKTMLDPTGTLVQLVGFSNPRAHLPRYLEMMAAAGYEEVTDRDSLGRAHRVWRNVPNRRWYNNTGSSPANGREVMLIHRPA
ncbi:MAG: site-specific DNA-methyltransferase [Flavobacteriales bacterium]|nr:MAG: site-specific DNA-methyltransferase [Flavobacteriales bacterium]